MKVNYQVLLSRTDPVPLLEKWRGGEAAIWAYTVSHRVLELRITREEDFGCLRIYAGDLQHLSGPVKWSQCNFQVVQVDDEMFRLQDQQAGFELRAGIVRADELPDKLIS